MKLSTKGKKLAVAAVLGGMSLTGISACSAMDSSNGTSVSQDEKKDLTKEKASELVKKYYSDVVGAAEGANDDYTKAQEVVEKTLDKEELEKFTADLGDPAKFSEAVGDDTANKVLPEIEKLDRIKDDFDMSELKPSEKLYLHIMNIAVPNGYLIYTGEQGLDVQAPADKFEITDGGSKAKINVKDLLFKSGEQEIPSSGFSMDSFTLKNSNGQWKIDGKSFMDEIGKFLQKSKEAAESAQATDPNLEQNK